MRRLHPFGFLSIIGLLVLALLIIVACTPNPSAQLISPDMVPEVKGQAFVQPTPTPLPDINMLTEEQIYAGLPADIAALMPGDPASGETLATSSGCVGCHLLDDTNIVIAPTWGRVADTALTRVAGEGPALYLYHSIMDPNVFVAPGYNAGIMPQTYKDTLSPQNVADIVSYLLAQRGQ